MSTNAMRYTAPVKQRGLTLIELIIFIVVVSVGIAGILMVLNVTVWHSADPMIRKNMLSIAEALVEEVQMMPFTYCDPTDANAATAGSGGCATTPEGMGPETIAGLVPSTQTRTSSTNPFNNVNDYAGLSIDSPIPDIDITGTSTAPTGYSARIEVVPEVLGGIASTESLRITVTVNHATTVAAGGDSITVEGYRTRYAPNFLP